MSKRCELTGISPLKGHNVSHAKNKTKRRFLPNLKKVTFRSDILKKDIKLNVANAALRSVDFKGGLDKFLISAKNAKLSKKVKKTFSVRRRNTYQKVGDLSTDTDIVCLIGVPSRTWKLE